jgi:hypothetical protein
MVDGVIHLPVGLDDRSVWARVTSFHLEKCGRLDARPSDGYFVMEKGRQPDWNIAHFPSCCICHYCSMSTKSSDKSFQASYIPYYSHSHSNSLKFDSLV